MKEVVGQRKVVLTKWSLIIFSFSTVGLMGLSVYHNTPLPDSFFMNFVLGLGGISGAFTVGNIFEHRAKAMAKRNENADTNPAPSYDDNNYRS